jgi:hypothetical protein
MAWEVRFFADRRAPDAKMARQFGLGNRTSRGEPQCDDHLFKLGICTIGQALVRGSRGGARSRPANNGNFGHTRPLH